MGFKRWPKAPWHVKHIRVERFGDHLLSMEPSMHLLILLKAFSILDIRLGSDKTPPKRIA